MIASVREGSNTCGRSLGLALLKILAMTAASKRPTRLKLFRERLRSNPYLTSSDPGSENVGISCSIAISTSLGIVL